MTARCNSSVTLDTEYYNIKSSSVWPDVAQHSTGKLYGVCLLQAHWIINLNTRPCELYAHACTCLSCICIIQVVSFGKPTFGYTYMHAGKLDGAQGWSAQTNDLNQWMEIDVEQVVLVSGVVTQGRRVAYYYLGIGALAQWVTKYRVSVSVDGRSWTMVQNGSEFEGNSDNDTPVRQLFEKPVLARYVRIMPTAWFLHITMRAAVMACIQDNGIQGLVRPRPYVYVNALQCT